MLVSEAFRTFRCSKLNNSFNKEYVKNYCICVYVFRQEVTVRALETVLFLRESS